MRPTDLLSEEQVLNSIFTRVIESDFLSQEKREEIVGHLLPVMLQAEEEPAGEATAATPTQPRSTLLSRTAALGLMGAAASLIGALVAAFPKIVNLDTAYPKLVPVMFFTLAVSGATIAALILFYRLRESQQELPSKAEAVASGAAFERDVANLLAKAGVSLEASGARDRGYDLGIQHGGRRIILEIKAWDRPMPLRVVAGVADRLRRVMAQDGASEAVIVTPTNLGIPQEVLGEGIRMMTLRDLRNYLVHRGSP